MGGKCVISFKHLKMTICYVTCITLFLTLFHESEANHGQKYLLFLNNKKRRSILAEYLLKRLKTKKVAVS